MILRLVLTIGFAVWFVAAISFGGNESTPTPHEEPLPPGPAWQQAFKAAGEQLVAKHGAAEKPRIDRGLVQTLRLWRAEDGDGPAWQQFVTTEFVPSGSDLDALLARLQFAFERLDGYMVSLGRDWRSAVDVERGPMLPLDERLAAFDFGAHLSEDLYQSKIAFVALLNFPQWELNEKMAGAATWSRRQWAEARLTDRFRDRLPAAVTQAITRAFTAAETYINGYNLHLHHLLSNGQRLFPAGKRLITHWGLRDEIKAQYGSAGAEALARQRTVYQAMLAIVTQSIPAAVIDNPKVDWDLVRGTLTPKTTPTAREDDTRYRRWLELFRAIHAADLHYPDDPTYLDRRFNRDREIPEARFVALLQSILESPLGAHVGKLAAQRLGRPLEPFDIWYNGFKPKPPVEEAQLDALTRKRYPSSEAFAADIPRILIDLGFSRSQADFVAAKITVDPSRGAGHALGMARRDDQAHLRTRVGADGMDYKGYNIAVHELGHNVEQTFSNVAIDHTLLGGVPNNAFTEAMAFLFQARDLKLLGLPGPSAEAERLRALDEFWATREICGVALVDIGAWHWLYDHREATPAEFREAVVKIAADVWNRYYAPIFGQKEIPLLAIYSHLVQYGLYTPDYALGHLIAFQVEEHFAKNPGKFGSEFERITRQGRLTPDAWMQGAVGAPLSAEPLLRAAERALKSK